MKLEDYNLQELSIVDQANIEGGFLVILAIGLAAFAMGYTMGKDAADNINEATYE